MKGDILETNERVISFLQSKNFGLLAYIEVGAVFVGKIVQSHSEKIFKRGDEKGYFLFGGSTVILIGEKGKWVPDQDLLDQTAQGIETWCKVGTAIAHQV
jgi:phosphatidylserine decarboxylase